MAAVGDERGILMTHRMSMRGIGQIYMIHVKVSRLQNTVHHMTMGLWKWFGPVLHTPTHTQTQTRTRTHTRAHTYIC